MADIRERESNIARGEGRDGISLLKVRRPNGNDINAVSLVDINSIPGECRQRRVFHPADARSDPIRSD